MVTEVPDIQKFKKEAFSAAKVYSGYEDVILYPVQNGIVFVFDQKEESKIDLVFPKFIKFLYDQGIEKFIAIYKKENTYYVFVHNEGEHHLFSFNEKEVIIAIISVIKKYGDGAKIAVVDNGEEIKKTMERILSILNEERIKEGKKPISIEDIIFVQVKVNQKDYERLLKKQNILQRIRKSFNENADKILTKLNKKQLVALLVLLFVSITAFWAYSFYYEKKKAESLHPKNAVNENQKLFRNRLIKNKKFFAAMTKAVSQIDHLEFFSYDGDFIFALSSKKIFDKEPRAFMNGNFFYFFPVSSFKIPLRSLKQKPMVRIDEILKRIGARKEIDIKGKKRFIQFALPLQKIDEIAKLDSFFLSGKREFNLQIEKAESEVVFRLFILRSSIQGAATPNRQSHKVYGGTISRG